MRARPASARAVKKQRIVANQHDLSKNLSAADYNPTPFRLFNALLYDSEKRRFCALLLVFTGNVALILTVIQPDYFRQDYT
jgi:hypothetical protein